jgi:hypothetical protein
MRNLIGFVLFLLLLLALILWPVFLHASTSTKQTNSLGYLAEDTNPYSYLAGSVLEGFDIDNEKGLVLRVQPMGMYQLFTQDVFMCGFPLKLLVNKSNPVVLVYETKEHKIVSGVGCHDLTKVYEIGQRRSK